jgi:hypothetical protein
MPMKLWLQRLTFLLAGLLLGLFVHFPQSNRFVPDPTDNAILDTKSGLVCAPIKTDGAILPYCGDLYNHY